MTDHKAEWVLLPREATEAMLREGCRAWTAGVNHMDALQLRWEAMIAAAPAASEGEDGGLLVSNVRSALGDHYSPDAGLIGSIALLTAAAPAPKPTRTIYATPAAQVAATPKHDEGRDDWIDAGVLRNQLAGYAEPECRECDGSGVYYGNVCICNCVLDAIPKHEALATQPAARRVTDGVALIAAERQRQVDEEGWTPEHDDEHMEGELAMAAHCYALPDIERLYDPRTNAPTTWPWSPEWWKPGIDPIDRIRELVKAGALIAAEIDRLRRAEPFAQPAEGVSGG